MIHRRSIISVLVGCDCSCLSWRRPEQEDELTGGGNICVRPPKVSVMCAADGTPNASKPNHYRWRACWLAPHSPEVGGTNTHTHTRLAPKPRMSLCGRQLAPRSKCPLSCARTTTSQTDALRSCCFLWLRLRSFSRL